MFFNDGEWWLVVLCNANDKADDKTNDHANVHANTV